LLPIGDAQLDYAQSVTDELKAKGVRAEVDRSGDKIGGKIRKCRNREGAYDVIIGQKEQDRWSRSCARAWKGRFGREAQDRSDCANRAGYSGRASFEMPFWAG